MVYSTLLSCALIALLSMTNITTAQDAPVQPEHLARRCVKKVKHIATRCVVKNRHTAARHVCKIRHLLKGSHDEAAKHVADHGIAKINHQSDACVEHIRKLCAEYVAHLVELGAPERVAEHVKQVGEDQIAMVRRSQRAAIQAIREVLAGASDPAVDKY